MHGMLFSNWLIIWFVKGLKIKAYACPQSPLLVEQKDMHMNSMVIRRPNGWSSIVFCLCSFPLKFLTN